MNKEQILENIKRHREEYERLKRGFIGRRGWTDTHHGVQYEVRFKDGTFLEVDVWTEHGIDEKNLHDKVFEMVKTEHPEWYDEIDYVVYC